MKDNTKVPRLEEMCKYENAVVLCLTESHLDENIKDAEINMKNFTIFRQDRMPGTQKGGVITYIRNDLALNAVELTKGAKGICEYQLIHLPDNNVILINMYRPPGANLEDFKSQMKEVNRAIDELGNPLPTIILTGDFNYPELKWPVDIVGRISKATPLLECMNKYALVNYITKPTRGNNILDLLLTNDDEMVRDVRVEDTDMSDHRMLKITSNLKIRLEKRKVNHDENILHKLSFHHSKINWQNINAELGLYNWEESLETENSEGAYEKTLNILKNICTKHIPLKKKFRRTSIIPQDRRRLMRARTRFQKRLTKKLSPNQSSELLRRVELLNEQIKCSHKEEGERKEKMAIEQIKRNPKYFWNYAMDKSKTKTKIGPFKENDKLITDPKEKANLLKEQYQSVFSSPKYGMNLTEDLLQRNFERGDFRDITLTEEDFFKSMGNLNPNSSSGPDGIHAKLMLKCKNELKTPMRIMWQKSINEGTIPERLKRANISPTYKGGKKINKANYRPVALTSHWIKVFEKVIVAKLTEHLEHGGFFNINQHGFRRGRSCLSQLLEHYTEIIHLICEKGSVDVAYLDFAKAFDKVDHGILIRKLMKVGVGGPILKWIHEFLTNRKQVVMVEGEKSEESPVTSGVPQGSVLGPLLFLIHIYDIDADMKYAKASSFADDTRVMKKIKDFTDCQNLQEDLEAVYKWAQDNNMAFNDNKFELLRYGNHPFPSHKYVTGSGEVVEEKSQVKDLGVIVQNDAEFKTHIDVIVNKCNKVMGYILRTFKTRKSDLMKHLFKALLLPLAEYCSQLWSPTDRASIQKLEGIQRSFTRKIAGMMDKDYWQRLKELSLYSLERRRERYQIIYVWKMINGLVPNFINPTTRIKTRNAGRRGILCQIPKVKPRLGAGYTLFKNSFAVKAATLFNLVPKEIREYTGSLPSMKSKLDIWLQKIKDEPALPTYITYDQGNSLLDWRKRLILDWPK